MHDLLTMLSLGVTASLAIAVLPGTARAVGPAGPPMATAMTDAEIAELRARGPGGLELALARYDRASVEGRAALEPAIDAIAGQRYATTSRLYWYTDLSRASAAARELGRPILALRMLGDLRVDLSCANSRLFRATLYANAELAGYLRSHFVLFWSSERDVPTVTIDFGGGRKLVRTTTGNSAHYVLDADGRVLDVLPGLYAPRVFQRELARSEALAAQVRGLPAPERVRALAAHHAALAEETDRLWRVVRRRALAAGQPVPRNAAPGAPAPDAPGANAPSDANAEPRAAIARAQLATVSKMAVEVPDLRAAGLIDASDVIDDTQGWIAIGRAAFAAAAPRGRRAPDVIDPASRALVARLHDAGPVAQRATPAALARVVARLEDQLLADTALNQFSLRQRIRRHLAQTADTDLSSVNAWIYDQVFATPASDPWLGLVPRSTFTGLPGDGVVVP